MGEILGLGVTHGPFVLYPESSMANIFKRALASPRTPPELRDSRNWPAAMQVEWGEDDGLGSAYVHRQQLVDGFRKTREVLDRFNPDVVLIWGDDQYENFHEDVVPAFCVYIEDEFRCKPFSRESGSGTAENVWGVGPDWELEVPGHPRAAKELATHLLGEKFDVAWAYKQLHHDLGHAFWRTVAHLDYDRVGFRYPIIPFHVNCYGRQFTRGRNEGQLDPPSPTPERCFELGAAVARFFQQSPYRAALIGSSSWSHAFLTQKHHLLWPDVETDKARYTELSAGDYQAWKRLPLAALEDAGEHEMLNWLCLAGAMDALARKPTYTEFVESWVSNSSKVFAAFEP
jgi:hypothetical protein